jgi:hypothetical protein
MDTLNARRPVSGAGADVVGYPTGTAINTPDVLPRDYSFFGVVVSTGPGGDADFTDQRYWVRSVVFGQAAGASPTDKVSAYVDWTAQAFWLVASNVAEIIAETHTLPAIESPTDLSVPVAAGATLVKVRQASCGGWILETVSSPGTFLARIIAVSGSFPTWTYTVQRVTGYDSGETAEEKWTTDGVDLTATNRAEFAGTPSYTYGTGSTITDVSGAVNGTSCLTIAIGVGAVVELRAGVDEEGSPIYSFIAMNSAQ